MATLLLSAAGAALGSGFGGTVLGLSGANIGRAVGATLGRVIDQRLLGAGSDPVDIGRIDRFRLTGASEGAPIAQLWGRLRIGGQLIWSTQFQENVRRGGGGKSTQPRVNEFSYSISLALGLCEGEILRVGRIWADGEEIAADSIAMRVYNGAEDQLPDPRIEAVEGTGQAPAYRGLAYVVIEDLDLSPYGNRVPQLTFEVIRNARAPGAQPLSDIVKSVALIPGTGEYTLATTPVHRTLSPGRTLALNVNTPSGKTDFQTSLVHLTEELPSCRSVSVVVSWFGNDLRCNTCQIKPKVEQNLFDAANMPWRAGGILRAQADIVPQVGGASIYGGTPTDQSVVQSIQAIRAAGREVMFYPFILMDQTNGNTLIDPYSGQTGQPALPWRGRITTSIAPGRVGSPDRTAAAELEVAQFFGQAAVNDFSVNGQIVSYAGPVEWGFRRFILHYAHLCAAAGGVDAFCIGSEMRGMTQLRGMALAFPTVSALKALAADVRSILGPQCKISYAADWTEYGSYQIAGNLYFPLDDLWAHPEIDFIGIDNYMPLSDWRDGLDHADAAAGSIYSADYLRANVMGGEGFDWYYDSPEGEAAQIRLPIEDGAHGEPWVFRVKDVTSWWTLPHHERTGSLRNSAPTAWVPGSKPIRFTEYGCAAIDKGTNHPNRFLDLLSSESALPRASTGRRDDLVQMQYLQAISSFWSDPINNPPATVYSGRMIDMERAHAWAWDARPFPIFPGRSDLWADAGSYARGHWLNGRVSNQSLAAVVAEIVAASGVNVETAVDVSRTFGLLRGYSQSQTQSGRAKLQPLMITFGVDSVERGGKIRFNSRVPAKGQAIDPEMLAVSKDTGGFEEFSRAPEAEGAGVVRFGHFDPEGAFDLRTAEARYPDDEFRNVAASEFPLSMTGEEARGVAERWLAETRIARDGVRLDLPPSMSDIGAGDLLNLSDGGQYRVDRVEVGDLRKVEAVRVEAGVYAPADRGDDAPSLRPFVAPVPVFPLFLDLPLMTGEEVPHAPHIAVAANPWPGSVSVWNSPDQENFEVNRLVAAPAIIGVTETDLLSARTGVWDRGAPLRIRLSDGAFAATSAQNVLNGANLLAIGDGSSGNWELVQFADAALVGTDTYEVGMRLRGQAGTDGIMPPVWPTGSTVVLIDRSVVQIDLALSARSLARTYRVGPTARGLLDPLVVTRSEAFDGVGLRPFPVAHLRVEGASGELVRASWIRRTRIDGDNWAQPDVPLGEDFELYAIRIKSGASVLAEYTSSSPDFEYSAAAQSADGVGATFLIEVAQISARFGAGPFLSATVGP